MKNLFFSLLLLSWSLMSCKMNSSEKKANDGVAWEDVKKVYSKHVKDTFDIRIQYPKVYDQDSVHHYPIVFLSDADLYFPVLAPILHQYEAVGILPPIVLVGIQYGTLERMDSLRNRDFLYPKAQESDEIAAPGGGEDFYQFLTQELISDLKSSGLTNNKRILMGHSFGGYFSLYAYLRQAELQRQDFSGFVSASPSLWYRDFYLSNLLTQQAGNLTESNVFLSIGDLEGEEWGLRPFNRFVSDLEKSTAKAFIHSQVYTDLGHMDVGLISFLQGLSMMMR